MTTDFDELSQLMLSLGVKSYSIDDLGRPVSVEYLNNERVQQEDDHEAVEYPFAQRAIDEYEPREDPDLWEDGERPRFQLERLKNSI